MYFILRAGKGEIQENICSTIYCIKYQLNTQNKITSLSLFSIAYLALKLKLIVVHLYIICKISYFAMTSVFAHIYNVLDFDRFHWKCARKTFKHVVQFNKSKNNILILKNDKQYILIKLSLSPNDLI